MKQEARIFLSPESVYNKEGFCKVRKEFFHAIVTRFGRRAEEGDGWILIHEALEGDRNLLDELSQQMKVRYECVIERSFTKGELTRACFVRLSVEGEPVDLDKNGVPLNAYGRTTCIECSMPDEYALPVPYQIAQERLEQSTGSYWGEGNLSTNREIFLGTCGVMIVCDRIKEVLQSIVGNGIVCAQACPHERTLVLSSRALWAIRPLVTWGVQEGRKEVSHCDVCGCALEARITHNDANPFAKDRLNMVAEVLPESDIVCAEGWFGDRRESPNGFSRDVFVSGRLYTLLMEMKTRGLCAASDPVWVQGEVPIRESMDCAEWLKTNRP